MNASAYLASIEEMLTATDELAASIDRVAESSARMGEGAVGADSLAASDDRAAGAAKGLSDAAYRAADAVKAQQDAFREFDVSVDATVGAVDELIAADDRLMVKMGEVDTAAVDSGGKLATFGAHSKMAFLAIGAAAIYSTVKAAEFQTQVTRLYTAAGLTGQNVSKVSQEIIKVGNATGFTGTQIAEAMYHPVSAGLSLKTSLAAVTYGAQLANIHGANLNDTMYALSSVMKAFNVNAGGAGNTAALLNAIVGQGDMRFQDFNQSVKNWAPTGAAMGISIRSMGAGLAYLTDRGNSAEVASTRLTMGLSMATAGSKAANEYMKDLGLTTGSLDLKNKSLQATMLAGGLSTNKFAADLKKPDGLYVALKDMQDAFHKAGLSSAQADTVMAKIFGGGRSDKAIVSLMSHLDGVKQKYESIGKGVANYGRDVAKEQATTEQKWKDTKAALSNLSITFGSVLLPAVTRILGVLDKFLVNLEKNKGGARELAGVIGGVLAVVVADKLVRSVEGGVKALGHLWETGGKVITLMGKIPGAVSSVVGVIGKIGSGVGKAFGVIVSAARTAFTAIAEAAAANPVIAIIIGIALLVVAFVELWKHCKAFRDFWKDIWRDIKGAFDVAFGWIKTHWQLIAAILTGPIGLAVLFIKDHWKQITGIFSDAWNVVKNVTRDAWNWIKGRIQEDVNGVKSILSWFGRLGSLFKGWFLDAYHAIVSAWDSAETFVRSIPHRVLTGLGDLGHLLWQGGINLIMGLVHGIESVAMAPVHAVESIVSDVRKFLPFSPAKTGPLSGSGSPDIAGRKFGQMFAEGILSGAPDVEAAMRGLTGGSAISLSAGRLAGAITAGAASGASGGAAGGGGNTTITINISVPGGFVGNEQQLASAMMPVFQKAVLQYSRRNTGNGLALTSR